MISESRIFTTCSDSLRTVGIKFIGNIIRQDVILTININNISVDHGKRSGVFTNDDSRSGHPERLC